MNGKTGEYLPIPGETEAIGMAIVDAAVKVHKRLGPGLLESVYEVCLAHELRKRGLVVESQVPVAVTYDELKLESGMRLDLLIAGQVVVEIKAVERVLPVHEAQVLTYLKLTGLRLGLLLNFDVARMKQGLHRFVR